MIPGCWIVRTEVPWPESLQCDIGSTLVGIGPKWLEMCSSAASHSRLRPLAVRRPQMRLGVFSVNIPASLVPMISTILRSISASAEGSTGMLNPLGPGKAWDACKKVNSINRAAAARNQSPVRRLRMRARKPEASGTYARNGYFALKVSRNGLGDLPGRARSRLPGSNPGATSRIAPRSRCDAPGFYSERNAERCDSQLVSVGICLHRRGVIFTAAFCFWLRSSSLIADLICCRSLVFVARRAKQ